MPHYLAKCKFAPLCGASAEPCQALRYVLLFSVNKYRDIRLIALPRILSCFLEALLSQVQVCILVAHQQSCRALNLCIVLDKQICRDICLVALLRILSCCLEASAALLSQVQVSGASAEPCRALNVSISFLINKYFAQDSELLFGSAALVGQVQVAFWRISRALPSLKYALLFSINKYRDIRLIALLRIQVAERTCSDNLCKELAWRTCSKELAPTTCSEELAQRTC